VLQVQFEVSSNVDALENLKDLKQLREFHFSFLYNEDAIFGVSNDKNITTEEFYSWCGQNLPKLKLIGGTFEDCLCSLGNEDNLSLVHHMSPEFSGVSDLETLHSEGNLPEASLPNLKKLMYCGTKMADAVNLFPTLSTYKNLTHFGVNCIKWQFLVQILEVVGQQLSHFFYELDKRAGDTLDHYQLFHLCPNLVYYEQAVADDAVFESPFKSSVSKHNFRNLQEFYAAEFPPDLYGMICQAPSIRLIWCFHLKFSKGLCLAVDSVERSFCNLEQFQLSFLKGLEDDCTLEDVEEMVKKVVCSAPKLKKIEVTWTDDSNCQDVWEKSGAVKFVELVKSREC